MKIALINEDSQASKNELIYSLLKNEVESKGHQVFNYGMYQEDQEHQINFTQIGILASILIETKAADFIVTGCGTGQGAMISCNAFQNLVCGYIATPLDSYLFTQVNAGNVVSFPWAQYYGWGAEINLKYMIEKIFEQDFGQGYPAIYAEGEKRSRVRMMDESKIPSQRPLIQALKMMDQKMLVELLNYDEFKEQFYQNAQACEVKEYIVNLLK